MWQFCCVVQSSEMSSVGGHPGRGARPLPSRIRNLECASECLDAALMNRRTQAVHSFGEEKGEEEETEERLAERVSVLAPRNPRQAVGGSGNPGWSEVVA